MLEDAIQEAIPATVRYYKSPRDLLSTELEADVAEDEDLSEALDSFDEISSKLALAKRRQFTTELMNYFGAPSPQPTLTSTEWKRLIETDQVRNAAIMQFLARTGSLNFSSGIRDWLVESGIQGVRSADRELAEDPPANGDGEELGDSDEAAD